MSDQNFQTDLISNTAQSEVVPQINYKPYVYTAIVALIAVGGLGYYLIPAQPSYEVQGIPDVATTTQSIDITQPTITTSGNTLSLVESGVVLQTFTLSQQGEFALHVIPSQPPQPFITNQDINFDGYSDLGVLTSTGYAGVNYFYDYFLYNATTKRFDKNETISGLGLLKIDTIKKQISSTLKSGPGYVTQTFNWNGSTFINPNEPEVEWSTYSGVTSEGTVFTVNYPRDWVVGEEQIENSKIPNISSPDFSKTGSEMDTRIESGSQIRIASVVPTSLTSLNSVINSDEFIANSASKNKISVDGALDAFEYVYRYESLFDRYVVLLIKDGYLWTVSYVSVSGSLEDGNYRIFKNIINSLQVNER